MNPSPTHVFNKMIREYQIIIAGLLVAVGLYFGLKESNSEYQPTDFDQCVNALLNAEKIGEKKYIKDYKVMSRAEIQIFCANRKLTKF